MIIIFEIALIMISENLNLHILRHGLLAKSVERLSGEEIRQIYLDTWRDAIIPLCTNRSQTTPHLCSDFQPSLSNNGICFTKNQAPINDIYRNLSYIKTFKDTFLKQRDEFPVLKNMGSGMRYKNTFLINANQVMDLKRGLKWNRTKQAKFRLGIHPNHDMPEIRDTSIKIDAGFKTTIRVNAMQLESQQSIRDVNVEKRKCRFSTESDNLVMFKRYSRYRYNSNMFSCL